jgi:hypothetical protein
MTIEIKKRWTGEVICTGKTVAEAVKAYLADLSQANLSHADLYQADLSQANLYQADLSWRSHDLLSEILKRSAGDDDDIAKLKVAGLLLVCREKCWQEFLDMRDPLLGWALDELAGWVQDDDGAPECVRERIKAEAPA